MGDIARREEYSWGTEWVLSGYSDFTYTDFGGLDHTTRYTINTETQEFELKSKKQYYYEEYENGLVGISNLPEIDVNIFPNPTADVIQFDVADQVSFNISIYTTSGKRVLSKEIFNRQRVDVSTLQAGMYFYILKGKNFAATGKFICK